MNVTAKLEALSVLELIKRTQKLGRSMAMLTQEEAVEGRGWYRSKERW